ncbi:hypothetical protein KKF91_03985 [Myxococcota bacterium]|nr:hypothetical protein [Myxococcota bacterium]
MRVYVEGQALSLSREDFIGAGGEGQVYIQGQRALKIYHDPSRALTLDKLHALRALPQPPFITPQALAHDEMGRIIGYAMAALPPQSLAFAQLNARAAWARLGFTLPHALSLLDRLRAALIEAHAQGIVLVDLSGVNARVGPDLASIYLIDTDSYQTPEHPATALQESLRDPLADEGFTPASDWFAFALLAFQILTGMHPYKGQHPTLKGLSARMRAGVSVFDPAVRRPPSCAPLTEIPDPYRAWLRAVFERGARRPPPRLEGAPVVIQASSRPEAPISERGALKIERIFEASTPILGLFSDGARLITRHKGGLRVDNGPLIPAAPDVEVGFMPLSGDPVALSLDPSGVARLWRLLDDQEITHTLRGAQAMSHEGRLYLKQGGQIGEVIWGGGGRIAGLHPVAQVLPRATRLWPGIAAQDVLGSAYLTVFPGPRRALQMRIPELDGYQLLDGRLEGGVARLIGALKGRVDRIWLRIDGATGRYDLSITPGVVYTGINFTALPGSKVAVELGEEGELRLSPCAVGAEGEKIITDPLPRESALARRGGQLLVIQNHSVYTATMR